MAALTRPTALTCLAAKTKKREYLHIRELYPDENDKTDNSEETNRAAAAGGRRDASREDGQCDTAA